jgi:hypothetical protein
MLLSNLTSGSDEISPNAKGSDLTDVLGFLSYWETKYCLSEVPMVRFIQLKPRPYREGRVRRETAGEIVRATDYSLTTASHVIGMKCYTCKTQHRLTVRRPVPDCGRHLIANDCIFA